MSLNYHTEFMDSSGGQLLYAAAGNQPSPSLCNFQQNTQETVSNNTFL